MIQFLLLFLIIYLPFEDFLLKFVPVGDATYLALRQMPDVLVIVMFVGTVLKKVISDNGFKIIDKRTDLYLVLFILLAFVSLMINQGSLLDGLANIKALVRYLLLIYVVLNIELDEGFKRKVTRLILVVVGIQLLVGFSELLLGGAVNSFFRPRPSQSELLGFGIKFTSSKVSQASYIFGTMGNNISYGMFLTVGLGITLVYINNFIIKYLAAALILIAIYASGSRSVTLAGGFVVFSYLFLKNNNIKAVGYSLGLAVVAALFLALVPLASIGQGFSSVFSNEYLEQAKHQRLGILYFVLPAFLHSKNILLGFSADQQILVNFIYSKAVMVPKQVALDLDKIVEDVYWLALLFYYGIAGMIFYVLFYFRLVKKHVLNLNMIQEDNYFFIGILVLLVAIPLNLFNQAFEVRQFSFYLWLFVAMNINLLKD